MRTVRLFRPVGPAELQKIAEAEFRAFPPRLDGQPYFYPVLHRQYAEQIARDWNAKESGVGYVTEFEVEAEFVVRYEVRVVGKSGLHEELWVPAEDLEEFNRHIVGKIRVVAEFRL